MTSNPIRSAAAAIFLSLTLAGVATSAEPFVAKTDLFEAGTDGYALYRIPGIVVTTKGTVLAYCEARKDGKGDWGPIDIVMRRSVDGGKSWLPRQIIVHVEGDLPVNPVAAAQDLDKPGDNTANNPVAFADRSGAVHFLYGKDTLVGPLDGKTDFGGKRDDFEVAGCEAFVIHPTKPAPNGAKPWVWYAPTIGNNPGRSNSWLFQRLMEQGFYVAGIYVGETFANPKSREQFAEFYQHVTQTYGLATKACLIAQSRGGLNHYNFAADHPEWVQCIAGIYTVADMRSFPKLERAAPAYGLTPAALESQLGRHNPIERLAPIAAAKIPILHIHGDADKIVPLEENSAVIAERYQALGGKMELVIIPGKGHESDPGFFESDKMLEFITSAAAGKPLQE